MTLDILTLFDLNQEMPLKIVRGKLGPFRIQVTIDTYSHIASGQLSIFLALPISFLLAPSPKYHNYFTFFGLVL
jgi:hypothetical protein